jgi:hypothetical protein
MELYEQIIKTCKQINDEAKSSMTKEITRKLNSIIKINKLTKELEFQAPKTKKT